MARYGASTSLSKVLQRVSAGVIFLKKNEIGRQLSLTSCETAPTAVSDASVMRQVGASESGYDRKEALARASFVPMKAARAESIQVTV